AARPGPGRGPTARGRPPSASGPYRGGRDPGGGSPDRRFEGPSPPREAIGRRGPSAWSSCRHRCVRPARPCRRRAARRTRPSGSHGRRPPARVREPAAWPDHYGPPDAMIGRSADTGGNAMSSTDALRDAFVERLFQSAVATMDVFTVYLGDRLGLYRTLSDGGPLTPGELAERAGIDARYAREWLAPPPARATPAHHPPPPPA